MASRYFTTFLSEFFFCFCLTTLSHAWKIILNCILPAQNISYQKCSTVDLSKSTESMYEISTCSSNEYCNLIRNIHQFIYKASSSERQNLNRLLLDTCIWQKLFGAATKSHIIFCVLALRSTHSIRHDKVDTNELQPGLKWQTIKKRITCDVRTTQTHSNDHLNVIKVDYNHNPQRVNANESSEWVSVRCVCLLLGSLWHRVTIKWRTKWRCLFMKKKTATTANNSGNKK